MGEWDTDASRSRKRTDEHGFGKEKYARIQAYFSDSCLSVRFRVAQRRIPFVVMRNIGAIRKVETKNSEAKEK